MNGRRYGTDMILVVGVLLSGCGLFDAGSTYFDATSYRNLTELKPHVEFLYETVIPTMTFGALAMKRGYLRVMPKALLPKSVASFQARSATLLIGEKLTARSYSNPFNPTAIIEYSLPEASCVTLRVFNVLGREVTRLVDGWQQEGVYTEVFNASRLPSGVYLYVLSSPFETVSGRMLPEK